MIADQLQVLVTSPLGEGGNGGIDRLMDSIDAELRRHKRSNLTVRFDITRGSGSILLSPFKLTRFLSGMILNRPDVIHINLASSGSTYRKLIIAALARKLGTPYVIHLHGGGYRTFWDATPPWMAALIKDMFIKAATVIVLGEVWRDYVSHKVPAVSPLVLPNAAPAPHLTHIPSSTRRLLFLGRLSKRKGVYDLIAALKGLAHVPGWQATLAGDGEIEMAKAKISELGLSSRVIVPGWVGPKDVSTLLAGADILILPSYDENLPISIIEAMACGLAVVATPVGAVEDIVKQDETGLLVMPGDVHALTCALMKLIESPDLVARMGSAGQDFHRAHLDIRPYTDALIAAWRQAAL